MLAENTPVKIEEVCKLLEWDSSFFDFKIARIIQLQISPLLLEEALKWCNIHKVTCLYFLCECNDYESISLAEKTGFNLVDIRLTFKCNIDANSYKPKIIKIDKYSVRYTKKSDIPYLKEISRYSYHESRFYWDQRFPNKRVQELYMRWIEKSCNEEDVLVMVKNDVPIGYITCEVSEYHVGKIGLVAVHPSYQGIGAGQLLVYSALEHFANRGANSVEVITQGRNLKAQRLYQRCGFLIYNAQMWYHKWFISNKSSTHHRA